MAGQIATGSIHHLRLTVTDVARSREFYTGLLLPFRDPETSRSS